MNFIETSLIFWVNIGKSLGDFSLTLGQLRKSSEDFGNLLPFSHCKVKVNITSSKLIWGYGGRFDGEEVSSPFSLKGGGWGSLIPGCFEEVGISGKCTVNSHYSHQFAVQKIALFVPTHLKGSLRKCAKTLCLAAVTQFK